MPNGPDPYVERLEEEKTSLEHRIKELQSEVRAINNLIYRHRSKAVALEQDETINQKNVDRLFFETVILELLRKTERGLRTGEIYKRMELEGYGLNYNTLRSYVTKMRDKKLIKKLTPQDYRWVTVD